MSTNAFLGLRGTGTWPSGIQPGDWNETILFLDKTADLVLTGFLAMLSKEQATDTEFSWWTKKIPDQFFTPTNDAVYKDAALTSAYTGGDLFTIGSIVYIKGIAADIGKFRTSHTVKMQKAGDSRYDTTGKVINRVIDGASSYIAVRMTTDAHATYGMESVDYVKVIGNAASQGETIKEGITYEPVKYSNLTQIHRTPFQITRTARKTKLRVGGSYEMMKMDSLLAHGLEREMAYLHGERWEGIGDNNQPETHSQGLLSAIEEFSPAANKSDYSLDSDYSSDTWLASGEEWLDKKLQDIFRYGSREKFGIAGVEALTAINTLIKAGGNFDYTARTAEYGIQVNTWTTPHGELNLKTHPLFSWDPTNKYDVVIFEPKELGRKFITDTTFTSDPDDKINRNRAMDGTEEEWLTEDGLLWRHPEKMGHLKGFGKLNVV